MNRGDNGGDVERELRDFFERAGTPEPSAKLRGATAADRLQAGPARPGGSRDARLGLSLVGLAAGIVLAGGVLVLAPSYKNSTIVGPSVSISPSAHASASLSVAISPSPSMSLIAVVTPGPTVSMGPSGAFTVVGATDASYSLSALLPDGHVLVTGDNSGTKPLGAELFDPATGRFSPIGSLNSMHDAGTATTLADGRVLVAGGVDAFSMAPTSAAEIYDPGTGNFVATGSMAAAQSGQVAILLHDGRVLVVGGGDSRTATAASAELYDPATGAFQPIAGPLTARYGCLATLLSDGRVLIAGGWAPSPPNSGTGESLTSAEIFDPETGRFTSVGSMSQRHSLGTLTLLQDGRVLVAGGALTAELFDPATGKFGPTGSMKLAREGPTATLLKDGRVLVAGGSVNLASTRLEDLASAEIFDPKTARFSATGSMSEPLAGSSATLLQDGRVLITGGGLASAELYQP